MQRIAYSHIFVSKPSDKGRAYRNKNMDLQNLMIMNTLKDLKAFSLDKKQMNQIEGGSQYCEHLQQMTRGEEAQGWSNENGMNGLKLGIPIVGSHSYQEGENNRNQFSVSASLSKGISWIKGYIFLDVAYSDSRSLLVRNDLKVPNTQRTWHIVPRLETDLFRWLTMKYKLNYAYSILALEDEETATRNISLNQQLSLRFSPFAKVSMELVAEHYHNESPTDRTRDFFLADFILSHKISSKWEIEVLAKNLMNEQRYVYTSFTDEASTVSRSYDIRPRNLMMTIKYSY